MRPRLLITLCLTACSVLPPAQAQDYPHLEKRGTATQLVVEGKPFLMLRG
jgi:hypothetical protein